MFNSSRNEYTNLDADDRKAGRGWLKPAIILLVSLGVVAALYTTQTGNSPAMKSLWNTKSVVKPDLRGRTYTIKCGHKSTKWLGKSREDYFKFRVPKGIKRVVFRTCGSKFDTGLDLYEGSDTMNGWKHYCDDCSPCPNHYGKNKYDEVFKLNVKAYGANDEELENGQLYTLMLKDYHDIGGRYNIEMDCYRTKKPHYTPPKYVTTDPPYETTETTLPGVVTTTEAPYETTQTTAKQSSTTTEAPYETTKTTAKQSSTTTEAPYETTKTTAKQSSTTTEAPYETTKTTAKQSSTTTEAPYETTKTTAKQSSTTTEAPYETTKTTAKQSSTTTEAPYETTKTTAKQSSTTTEAPYETTKTTAKQSSTTTEAPYETTKTTAKQSSTTEAPYETTKRAYTRPPYGYSRPTYKN